MLHKIRLFILKLFKGIPKEDSIIKREIEITPKYKSTMELTGRFIPPFVYIPNDEQQEVEALAKRYIARDIAEQIEKFIKITSIYNPSFDREEYIGYIEIVVGGTKDENTNNKY